MLGLLLAVLHPLTCLMINSDRIYIRDLAPAVPAFAALPPDVQVGLAPAPGQQRIFRVPELRRIAAANHLDGEFPEDVCFAWKLGAPDQAQMLLAMQKSLEGRSPTIQIIDSSLMLVPAGKIVFPVSGLITGSDKPSVWRGFIEYASAKKFPIWARVLVRVNETRVVAAYDLREGDTARADAFKMVTYEGPILREQYIAEPSALEGLLLRRPVSAGTPLSREMFEIPREVNRGDTVHAILQTGAARLDVQGVAESDGRKGQIISVRNPRSGRSFRARVEDKETVVVVPGGQFGLAVEGRRS